MKYLSLAQRRGFTLVELLVVVGIIGLLAAVVLFSVSGARENARDKKRIADIKQYQLAFKLYVEQNGSLPDCNGGVYMRESGFSGGTCPDSANMEAFFRDFIGRIPTDPLDDRVSGPGKYMYVYDSRHDACDDPDTGTDENPPILAVRTMEGQSPVPWTEVCNNLGANGDLGSAKDEEPYIIRLDNF